MVPRFRSALFATAGFAAGLAAAAVARQQEPADRPPVVDVQSGQLYGGGKGAPFTLRPVGVMVGGESRPLGPPLSRPVGFGDPNESSAVLVRLTVNGVVIRADFEVEPAANP